jgi:predicted DNA-binding ribbon-helix-helix protein
VSMPPLTAKSRLEIKNVGVGTNRTSMRLEPEVWDAIREICRREGVHSSELVNRAVLVHPNGGRTSAVRVFVVEYFRKAAP